MSRVFVTTETALGRRGRAARRIGAMLLCLTTSAAASGQPVPALPAAPCARDGPASAGSALPVPHCLELLPAPGLSGVTARAELSPVPGPFGVAVTEAGAERYRLVVHIDGAPEPSSLGPYSTYVAWLTSLALDSIVRLGEVRNGRADLGEIDRARFRLLVTAERSATPPVRAGRIVMRGTSPGALLFAHRDVVRPLSRPSAPAVVERGSSGSAAHAHHQHGAPDGEVAAHWRMPPMPATMGAMPGLDGLRPSVAPFRPGATMDVARLPAARPRELVRLTNGDTLRLEAAAVRRTMGGRSFVMYGFNGQYPGPLLEVGQGTSVTVHFVNRTEMPSTVHWHGVRLDNRFDGVPDLTQPAVAPGDSFTYTVRFPDAGLYWYHPHVREDIQQDLGLYGNILVRSSRPDGLAPVHGEQVLMLDDLLLDEAGPHPYGREAPTHALMGRFGNVLLVNGEPRYQLAVRRGEVVRFYLTNVSNARVFNVSFGGLPVKVVATDLGRYERESWVQSVVIAPAERYIVDVRFPSAGTVPVVNRVQAMDHMTGAAWAQSDTLGAIVVAREAVAKDLGASFARLRRHADVTAEIDRYREHFGRAPDRRLTLALRARELPLPVASMLGGVAVPVDWTDGMTMINWLTTGREITWVLRDDDTGRENEDVEWRFATGDVAVVRLFNDPVAGHAMAHPIHVHGQRFLVLRRNGVANPHLAWKDTAIVPAGEYVDILVEFTNPGRWMLHCHVAEHLGTGMMTHFTVDGAPASGAP